MSNNQALFQRLLRLHPKKIDLSLDRIKKLLAKLHHPERSFHKAITVTGTNGKGSVCRFLKSLLEEHGKTVNLYTSPHLQKFNERITLQANDISDEFLEEVLTEVEKINKNDPITFFEITTAAAYLAFKQKPAEYTILETGLGGRLDATNVIEQPIAQVLTSISFDHQEFLGNTLQKIAYEKCAIFKNNTTIIISKQCPEVLKYIDQETRSNNSKKIFFAEDFNYQIENQRFIYQDDNSLMDLNMPSLQGEYQLVNAATAIATVKCILKSLDNTKTSAALKKAYNKGRLEKIKKGKLREFISEDNELYVDGSHNEEGGRVTADFLQTIKKKKIYLIFGMLKNKNAKEFLKYFSNIATSLKAIKIPNQENTMDENDIIKTANELGIQSSASSSIINALIETSKEDPNGLIIITGSLYLAGEVLNLN
ncbi:MAG: bifunctional folylpolyglutamate synthase/dihydrofolate synthase [Pelagibacterales bacterium]|nr:bifunctional folylpolyglutamate synthase/dihydrofolate synthase [Pelagibacterales bacterium]